MSISLNTHTAPWQGRGMASAASVAASHAVQQAQEYQSNHQFIAMLDAYRCSGGLARTQEVVAMFKVHGGPDASALADWIAQRKMISFEWQSKTWIPLFQFSHVSRTLQPGLSEVLAELIAVYNDWDVATWFSQPNRWLADCTPADALTAATREVLNAARVERYVAAGS